MIINIEISANKTTEIPTTLKVISSTPLVTPKTNSWAFLDIRKLSGSLIILENRFSVISAPRLPKKNKILRVKKSEKKVLPIKITVELTQSRMIILSFSKLFRLTISRTEFRKLRPASEFLPCTEILMIRPTNPTPIKSSNPIANWTNTIRESRFLTGLVTKSIARK
jgi:hypothetical protein